MSRFTSIRRLSGTFSVLTLVIIACTLQCCAEAESPTVPAEQVNSIFDVANEEYKAGNFENAIRLYQGLLSDPGIRAADIHYDIGNAAYRLKDYGRAIASYRRSLKLAPRDQDTVANLRFVREATIDKIDQPKSAALMREIFFFHYGLNAGETEALFLGAYAAAVLLGIAMLWSKSRTLRWLTLAALFLAVTFGASRFLKWHSTANPDTAVVVAEETDVHTGPGHNYIVSFNLHDGAELIISRVENDWCQIELPDGRRGWVETSHLEVI